MKKILIASLLLCLKLNGYSQTLATDFNVNDCSGVPHHLFSELDSGKVIVLCFVMPCFGCISPTSTTRNVVKTFKYSHPYKVDMYMVDDEANGACADLSAWESDNYVWSVPKFSDPAVVQGQYGPLGMPKIVVLGGSGHYVYAIHNTAVDSVQLTNEINAAISGVIPAPMPNSVRQTGKMQHVSLSPNPGKDRLMLNCDLISAADVRVDIFDAMGSYVKTVIKEGQPAGNCIVSVNTEDLSSGNYFLNLQAGDSQQTLKFTIRK